MPQVFDRYARYYDLLYSDKNYEKECDFLECLFKQFLQKKPEEILDIGCGTGGHMIPLLRRGYRVTGIDASKSMAELANKKLKNLGIEGKIIVGRMSDFKLSKSFDAAISMFAVVNYIIDTDELLKSFSNVRKHLKKDALFTFDFWYGPAVLSIKPSTRMKVVEAYKIKVIRFVTAEIDTFRHIVKSHYYLIVMKGDKVMDELRETHVLRYFFPQELIHYLKESGFEVLRFCAFPNLEEEPRDDTWNVAVVAKAV